MQWRRVRGFATCVAMAGVSACTEYPGGPNLTTTEKSHLLKVQASGGGSGTIASLDASPEILCLVSFGALSGQCAGGYPSNAAVRLVATPNKGFAFAGWSGACAGTDCVVDMSLERTVTAAFSQATAAVR